MKKNILYICMACLSLGMVACSTDPLDATEKHVYGPDENPYLRTDVSATINYSAEYRKGHVEQNTIFLKDYAETIQNKLGMTVDEMLSAVENGNVVFYNIKSARSCWDKTAPTKGSTGWYYDKSGNICDQASGVASVELDKTNKCLVVSVPEDAQAGALSVNVGFAIDNGKDFDDYVRFNIAISVNDPGIAMKTVSIAEGQWNAVTVNFSEFAEAIEGGIGMTVSEFSEKAMDTESGMALYIVDENGNWNTTSSYTANGLGYHLDSKNGVVTWESSWYYVETTDGGVNIGRNTATSGSTTLAHFVYTMTSDPSQYVEFIITVNFE